MTHTIDWTAPLELSDGTPVKLCPYRDGINPDGDGDYFLVREDGKPFADARYGHRTTVFIANPDGREWLHQVGTRVRNRKPTFDPSKPAQTRDGGTAKIIAINPAAWPQGTKAIGGETILAETERSGKRELTAYFADGRAYAHRTDREDLVNVPEKRAAVSVYYRTFGHCGTGSLRLPTLDRARGYVSTGSCSDLGILRFTEVDDKVTDMKLVYVA
jgi:hypothetical protein